MDEQTRRTAMAVGGGLVLATATAAGVALAGPALAGPPRSFEVACTNGTSFTVEGQLAGNAWHVDDGSGPFVLTGLQVEGRELVKTSPGKKALTTHTCTATNERGETADVSGFFPGS